VDKKQASERGKKMSKAIRAHNFGVTVAMVLIAAVVLLMTAVFVLQQTATTGDRTDTPAMSAGGAGVASPDREPYIDRHAEVIARHNGYGAR
jgi:3-deoxy-D-manno-octulosonate 8-phosphate phosphatase KdsC-like HAD superfamily phosphatase